MKNYPRDKEKGILVLIILLVCMFYLPYGFQVLSFEISASVTPYQLHINEFAASNKSMLQDQDGDYVDWIEIYNAGEEDINLFGFYLSDKENDPLRWMFPQVEVPAKGFLLIFASGKDRVNSNELHTNFSIKTSGEPLILTAPDGITVIDYVEPISLLSDTSYGRYPDGSNAWYYYVNGSMTPGRENLLPQQNPNPPLLSQPSGFYEEAFYLVMESEEDTTIYYTLDGSEPNPYEHSSVYSIKEDYSSDEILRRESVTFKYTEPIFIDTTSDTLHISLINTTHSLVPENYRWKEPEDIIQKGIVVRAIAYQKGQMPSQIITRTYSFGKTSKDLVLPVIFLTINPKYLFDYEDGIYIPGKIFDDFLRENDLDEYEHYAMYPANYHQRGREWERPAHIEFLEERGVLGFSQNIGLRIHGGYTRSYPLKSLRLYASSDYDGQNTFQHEIFPGAITNGDKEPLTLWKRLILRNGGQSFFKTMLPDAIMQLSFIGMGEVDLQLVRPAILFINSEYWGITTIYERLDKYYLHYHYGVNPDSVVLLEGPFPRSARIKEGTEEDRLDFINMVNFSQNKDLSNDLYYDEIASLMDAESFIDYNILRIYSGDIDSITKHLHVWRENNYDESTRSFTPTKWRWQTWDFDLSLALYNVDFDLLTRSTDVELGGYTALFRNLLENKRFRDSFIHSFAHHLNTTFVPERMREIIEDLSYLYRSEIVDHKKRWGYPLTMDIWEYDTSSYIQWSQERPHIQRQQIVDFFNLEGTAHIELVFDSSKGNIAINDYLIDVEHFKERSYQWPGIYFKGIPIHLMATPKPGYEFSYWKIVDGEGHRIDQNYVSWTLSKDIYVEAFFIKEDH